MSIFRFVLFATLLFIGGTSNENGFILTVIHTNDIHSHFEESNKRGGTCSETNKRAKECFGGVARILTKVKELKARSENPLFFNAGDFYQGTTWYTVHRHKIVSEAMSRMMYDAVCLGNHEFDDGPEGLVPFLKKMEAANVAVLGTNLETSEEPRMEGIRLRRSIVYTIQGQKIGVMGVVTTETRTIAKPGRVKILDEIISIRAQVKRLRQKGVLIFILISHVGYAKDIEIAKAIPELQLIVGGHSNTFLYTGRSPRKEDVIEGPYPTVVKRGGGSIALVLQSFWFGKYLGHLKLQFSNDGQLTGWDGNPILMDQSIQEDILMIKMLAAYKKQVEKAGKECIGFTKVLLEASHKVCRLKECNMANLIADAFLAHYANRKSAMPHAWSNVNAAVVNAGITKWSIPQGAIRKENMMSAMPFEGTLVVLTMSGAQLWKMFNFSVSQFTWYDDPVGAFLQVSGIMVAYNFACRAFHRVVRLEILCANCSIPKYEPVRWKNTYKIVTTNYIANGGDGFTFDTAVKKETEGAIDNEVVTEYIRKMSPIKQAEEGRVVMYNNKRPAGATSGGLYPADQSQG
uniref:5'-nucleotidase n=1 Tax=Ixodes ricinus TaxID=34613 RepID=A0A147BRD5_IXORI